jgi:hypothetical protein
MLNHCNTAKVVAVTINGCILCFLLLYKSRFYLISRAVHGRMNAVLYGIEPYRPFRQQSTEIPDDTGAVAVIRHRTAVGVPVPHGAQPYTSPFMMKIDKRTTSLAMSTLLSA